MKSTSMLVLLALATVASAMEQVVQIPAQFQGRRASSARHCAQGGESVFVIERDRVHFYESNGKILAVRNPTPLRLELDLELTGEGSTWRDTITFELSQDQQTLTDPTRQDPTRPWSRMRCS